MKQKLDRLISVLLCVLLVLGVFPVSALAGEQTKEAFALGTMHHGFRVYQVESIGYLGIDLYFMEHEKTGAQMIYAACDDTNRAFGVSFRTQGVDDKGMPHVFEHSALSGSDKYPDSNLVFSMMNQTYSTFINAETGEFFTRYPTSSLSEEQLFVNMDVYMSGVLHPILLTDERAMMREAWHYNLDNAESDITISGVVYSEMAANYNNMQYVVERKLNKLLFPGSYSANDTGGDPSVIPDLTYQELLDFHEKYYHPSNMLMMLYGDFADIERFFAHLDTEYLSQYERKEMNLDDPAYTPLQGYQELYFRIPATMSAESAHATTINYAFVLDDLSYADYMLAAMASSSLSAEGSPVKQRVNEAFPGPSFSVTVGNNAAQPTLCFTLMNAEPEDAPAFKDIVDEMLPTIVEMEFDESIIDAIINREKYQQSIARESSNGGVSIFGNFVDAWSRSGKPDAYMEEFSFIDELENYKRDGSINTVMGRVLSASTASAMLVATPEPGLAEKNAEELANRLAEMKAAMTDEEIQALVQKCADFKAWIAGNEKVSLIDQVKAVNARSLPDEYAVASVTDETVDGIHRITSEVPDSKVFHAGIYLDAQGIPFEILLDASLATSLIGTLGTENYSKSELYSERISKINSLSNNLEVLYFGDGTAHLYLHIDTGGLIDQLDDTFRLAEEVLLHTDFNDYDAIRETASTEVLLADTFASMVPHVYMDFMGKAAVNPDHYLDYYLGCSTDYKQYLERVSKMSDEELAAYIPRIQNTLDYMLNRPGAIITAVGSQESIERCVEKSNEFLSKLGNETYAPVNYGAYSTMKGNFAFVLDTSVSYNYIFLNMAAAGEKVTGRHMVAQALLTDMFLLPELRFRNNAYGASNSVEMEFAYLSTYRDPNFTETYKIFKTIPEKLRALELTQEQIDGYITLAYSAIVAPRGPIARANEAVDDALKHNDSGRKLRYIQEIKATTVDDIRAAADFYEKLVTEGTIAAAISEKTYNENAELFETVLRRTAK